MKPTTSNSTQNNDDDELPRAIKIIINIYFYVRVAITISLLVISIPLSVTITYCIKLKYLVNAKFDGWEYIRTAKEMEEECSSVNKKLKPVIMLSSLFFWIEVIWHPSVTAYKYIFL